MHNRLSRSAWRLQQTHTTPFVAINLRLSYWHLAIKVTCTSDEYQETS